MIKFCMKLFDRIDVSRVGIKVPDFQWIFFSIQEFPVINVRFVVVNKLVTICNNSHMRPDSMGNREFIVVIIERLAPI